MKISPPEFDSPKIRRVYDEDTETWWFSVIDVVQVLTQQADYQTAREYWNQLNERLGKEGSESATNCHRLKTIRCHKPVYLVGTPARSRRNHEKEMLI
jgi:DNA-damage-inducible protein D